MRAKAWLKSRLRPLAESGLYWSGISSVGEALSKPKGAIILMYHSVAPRWAERYIDPPNRISPELFERQMRFLRRHRRVVSLTDLLRDLDAGVAPPAGTVCLTFDDGYLDNLEIAAPILKKLDLPATLYLATGYVSRGENQWADVLYAFLLHRSRDELDLPQLGIWRANLNVVRDVETVRAKLHAHLLEGSWNEREETLRIVKRQLRPNGGVPRLTMTWEEARELRKEFPLFEIGGHTSDHVDLRTRVDEGDHQVRACVVDLQRELDVDPTDFSFPYSRWSAAAQRVVRAHGYRSAAGMGTRYRITPESDRFALPRVEAPQTMTELRYRTSGAFQSPW
jgi:peptidoglycan/xylan/chitin deacetylase (PgdA/CDA1 family)